MVLHDYKCLAHGIFKNSSTGKCPHGCADRFVSVVFLTPPAYHGGRTKNIDKQLTALAKDAGLTDMNNQNGTSSVFSPQPTISPEDNRAMMLAGQTYARSLGQGDTAISQSMQSVGAPAENNLAPVKHLLKWNNHTQKIDSKS